MTTKPLPTDLPIHSFPAATDFETFLEREHATAPGIYLKLAKKSSGIASITGAEAVEVALCFGWIDGRANGIDDTWWLVRYTPRRAKSVWSQKNVTTIGRLVEAGRVRPAGIAAVEAARADGRWDRAYAGPATITVPDDFAEALRGNEAAAAFFDGLNKSMRYSVLWRIETASEKARASRIQAMVELLADGKCPGADAKAVGRTKKSSEKQTSVIRAVRKKRKQDGSEEVDRTLLVEANSSQHPRREGLRRRLQGN
ncbi:hypothetical protein FKW77_004612 [Venturia effusa]|uniref:Bacteriocin-protection protein n=1 Tax=Venturia effusa TaxID=50376 RepID=A0A517KZC9_9PEZI|nr:hypothetical protein FKW77_004612 [Venturia effusa]